MGLIPIQRKQNTENGKMAESGLFLLFKKMHQKKHTVQRTYIYVTCFKPQTNKPA